MSDKKIYTYTEKNTYIDEEGNENTSIKETTHSFARIEEPDFIKVYTKMWCTFADVDVKWQPLFYQLIIRMSYANASDLASSQLVNTGGPWRKEIMTALGWSPEKSRSMYQKGLKALCDCNAIRCVGKGIYQINPQFAGKGEWKYNPQLKRGGIKDLVATFSFAERKVETRTVWEDDGIDNPFNEMYREGLGVTAKNQTRLISITKIKDDRDGEMSANSI